MKQHSDAIRSAIKAGKTLRCSHVFCGTPMLTEAIAMRGFDAIWIDMEHTAIEKQEVLANMIAANAGGAAAFVRIPWNDMVLAKPIIDMGPDGIIFPYVRTVEEARQAVAACAYPPCGVRGFGPLRAKEYGAIDGYTYTHETYRNMLRLIQIEHIDAVNVLEELVQLDGIDGFVVGPNDLAGSMGHTGEPNAPEMLPVQERIGKILKNSGKLFGVSVGYDPAVLKMWIDRGVNMLFAGDDVSYVYEGAHRVYDGMTALLG